MAYAEIYLIIITLLIAFDMLTGNTTNNIIAVAHCSPGIWPDENCDVSHHQITTRVSGHTGQFGM